MIKSNEIIAINWWMRECVSNSSDDRALGHWKWRKYVGDETGDKRRHQRHRRHQTVLPAQSDTSGPDVHCHILLSPFFILFILTFFKSPFGILRDSWKHSLRCYSDIFGRFLKTFQTNLVVPSRFFRYCQKLWKKEIFSKNCTGIAREFQKPAQIFLEKDSWKHLFHFLIQMPKML